MTRSIKAIFAVAVISLLFSSCAVYTARNIKTGTTMPDIVRLNLTLDDYEFVGVTEIEAEYHRYLGLITYVNTINGKPVSNNDNYVFLRGRKHIQVAGSRQLTKALYKAYKEFPDADFLMPTMSTAQVQQMFLGRKVKVSAKVKAYKIRK
ncbi:MAG: hypothetical protein H6586_05525 [Flavobacteriales bacterium]|nr:hypothetical protein [Flavobacteriales bacterium]